MIEFRVNEKSYKIYWSEDESYSSLFLVLTPLCPLKRVNNQKLELDRNFNHKLRPIEILKTNTNNWQEYPGYVCYSRYSCELYSNKDAIGEPLKCQEINIGREIEIFTAAVPYADGFDLLTIRAEVFIPENLFWLKFRHTKMDLKFPLPVMWRDENNEFITQCYLYRDAYKHLELGIDEDIADCVCYKKC